MAEFSHNPSGKGDGDDTDAGHPPAADPVDTNAGYHPSGDGDGDGDGEVDDGEVDDTKADPDQEAVDKLSPLCCRRLFKYYFNRAVGWRFFREEEGESSSEHQSGVISIEEGDCNSTNQTAEEAAIGISLKKKKKRKISRSIELEDPKPYFVKTSLEEKARIFGLSESTLEERIHLWAYEMESDPEVQAAFQYFNSCRPTFNPPPSQLLTYPVQRLVVRKAKSDSDGYPPPSSTNQKRKRKIYRSIELEDLLPFFGNTTIEEAARSLGVSVDTLKRLCCKHGIYQWANWTKPLLPAPILRLFQHFQQDSPPQSESLSSSSPPPSRSSMISVTSPVERLLHIKAKSDLAVRFIIFEFSFLGTLDDLKAELAQELELNAGSFTIEYEDQEGNMIEIKESSQLRNCIREMDMLSFGKITTIKLFVKTNGELE